MIGTLIEGGADITATDSRGNTVLHAAHNAETVGLLVALGARLNARNDAGETALWRSVVSHQNPELAEALLDAGGIPDLVPDNEATELAHAFERRDLELLRILVAHGADVNAYARSTWEGEPNLYYGVYRGEPPPGTPTYWEGSLLFKAVYDNDIAMASLLLDLGASPNSLALNGGRETYRDQYTNGEPTSYRFVYASKSSPFMLAVQREGLALAERMLIAGANANAMYSDRFEFPNGEEDSNSYSPLSMAVPTGNAEIVSLLLAHGADANAVPCVLHQSALSANLDMVTLLIEASVDVDAFCSVGLLYDDMTALEIAVGARPRGHSHLDPWPTDVLLVRRAIVKALIDEGADVNQSSDNRLAIHGAVHTNPDVRNLELLIEAGANIDAIGSYGNPLYIAATNSTVDNRVSKVQVLIDACADLEVASEGQTALEHLRSFTRSGSVFVEREDHEIYDLLRRANRRQRQIGCE